MKFSHGQPEPLFEADDFCDKSIAESIGFLRSEEGYACWRL